MNEILKAVAGRHLMIGVEGKKVNTAMLRRFTATHAAGLILFARNFESPRQIKKLIHDLQTKLGRALLVAVDQEGGRVLRFTKGLTQFPDALTAGTKGISYLRRQGQCEAKELAALGIRMNLAPVLDVLGPHLNPAIGNRSYGKDPQKVGRLGAARIQGMQEKGLWACAKHFPGIGLAKMDPHYELPVIRARSEFRKHLIPFRMAIKAGVRSVMSSHVLYTDFDCHPATFSHKIIRKLLRKKLKYSGLVLSDDLEMGALRRFGSVGEAASKAVQAGHDLVLVCQDEKKQREAHAALCRYLSQIKGKI